MKAKWSGVSRVCYYGFLALVTVAAVTAIGRSALSVYAKNTHAASSTAWYSTSSNTPATSENGAPDKAALDNARQYAKSMSKAFHAASEQVLPAVVTITSKPSLGKSSKNSTSPDQGDADAD
jgi:hypothetical protein